MVAQIISITEERARRAGLDPFEQAAPPRPALGHCTHCGQPHLSLGPALRGARCRVCHRPSVVFE